MHVYDFASRTIDGTWLCKSFLAADDDQAVRYALSIRTADFPCDRRNASARVLVEHRSAAATASGWAVIQAALVALFADVVVISG